MQQISLRRIIPFFLLALVAVAAIFVPVLPHFADEGKYNAADIAWVIVATALVFLMTPGLAFFYGGMVHRKNVISTMIKSVVAAGVVVAAGSGFFSGVGVGFAGGSSSSSSAAAAPAWLNTSEG